MTTTIASRYLCRDHLVAVTWRGRGCTSCFDEHQERIAHRLNERARRRQRQLALEAGRTGTAA